MQQFIQQAINERSDEIKLNSKLIDDLIAERYDSEQHITPINASEKNRIKHMILHPDSIKQLAEQQLIDEGIIILCLFKI